MLKSLSQTEEQLITYDLRQVAAISRSISPQGAIRLIAGSASLRGRIKSVDLNDPFFERVMGTVTTNAALDIMRLAAALHPEWQRFGFDDIAARVGVGVLGRHTAEGDAVAAGEVLLALIPEIIARRLRTVGELIWFQDIAGPMS